MKRPAERAAASGARRARPLSVRRARNILSLFWILATGPLILLVIVQTVLGKYGQDWQIAWGWLSPLVFPILSLVLAFSVLSADPAAKRPFRAPAVFWGTMILCGFYVAMLWSVILLEPVSELGWVNLMKFLGWPLGVVQGVVAGAVTRFFLVSLR